jgi:hypothetical protein
VKNNISQSINVFRRRIFGPKREEVTGDLDKSA